MTVEELKAEAKKLGYRITPNVWCTGCSHAKDKQYDTFAPVTYYCSKRGFRVPAYHPTVDCQDYKDR